MRVAHQTIYEKINTILTEDADLKSMVKYSESLLNIRRGFALVKEDWERLVLYYLQPEIPFGNVSMKILEIPLIVRVYDKKDDLQVGDIAERLKLLLDGANLSVTDKIHCYDCTYMGELASTNWNNEYKAFEKILRFKILARIIGIVGNSGVPSTNRQRNYN